MSLCLGSFTEYSYLSASYVNLSLSSFLPISLLSSSLAVCVRPPEVAARWRLGRAALRGQRRALRVHQEEHEALRQAQQEGHPLRALQGERSLLFFACSSLFDQHPVSVFNPTGPTGWLTERLFLPSVSISASLYVHLLFPSVPFVSPLFPSLFPLCVRLCLPLCLLTCCFLSELRTVSVSNLDLCGSVFWLSARISLSDQ